MGFSQIAKYEGKCLTCQYWIGNSRLMSWDDVEQFKDIKGQCILGEIHKPNPDFYQGVPSPADKSCSSWEVKNHLEYEYKKYLKEKKERAEKEAEKERKFKEEEERLINATKQGDMEAQFKLGSFYYTNYNKWEASIWFEKAAAQGHAEAIIRLAVMDKEKSKGKRNKILRYIIGGIFGGILGFILAFFMVYPQINVIAMIISVIVGLVSGIFIGKFSQMVLIDAILGAVIFGISFAIIYGIFIGSIISGILVGAIFGAIDGVIIGISCIKIR